jgi:DNA-binding transcriptional LysR family regulator
MRSLGKSTRILVASPQVASQVAEIEQLAILPALATNDAADDLEWLVESDDGRKQVVRVQPRLGCEDMATVRDAAIAGLGVAILPDHVCREALDSGRLVRILPAWHGLQGIVHLVFTTRRGLPPAVRALIDHLAAGFPREDRGRQA